MAKILIRSQLNTLYFFFNKVPIFKQLNYINFVISVCHIFYIQFSSYIWIFVHRHGIACKKQH